MRLSARTYYQGAWIPRDKSNYFESVTKRDMVIIEFEANEDWAPYERDEKAIEAVHKGADADNGWFSYVHRKEIWGLRTVCLTHRPLKGKIK